MFKNTFINLGARLSDKELAEAIRSIRPGFLIALRLTLLSLAICTAGVWFAYGSGTATLLIFPSLALAIVRIMLVRREARAYLMLEKQLDEDDLAGVIENTREILLWGPIAGSKYRNALFAILAEVAWRKNLDHDGLIICNFVISNTSKHRTALSRVLLLATQIYALGKNTKAANETFQKFQEYNFQLTASAMAQLYFTACVLLFRQGKTKEMHEILKLHQEDLKILDTKRLEILKTLTSE